MSIMRQRKVFSMRAAPLDQKHGFLSFICLIGTCSFKVHVTAFISKYGHCTAIQLFNSIGSNLQPLQQHQR